jgi:hypothetical protein
VRDSTWATGRAARSGPCLVERADSNAAPFGPPRFSCDHAEEDRWDDLTLELEALVLGVTRFKERAQLIGHWEHPAFAVLRCRRVQPYLASLEVDLAPFERQFGRTRHPVM